MGQEKRRHLQLQIVYDIRQDYRLFHTICLSLYESWGAGGSWKKNQVVPRTRLPLLCYPDETEEKSLYRGVVLTVYDPQSRFCRCSAMGVGEMESGRP